MFNLTASKNKKFLPFLLFLICIYGLLKGAQAPGIWGFSHYLFDYSFGFMRRGFVGEVSGYLFGDAAKSYHYYFYLSISLLVINYSLLFILALKKLGTNSRSFFLIAVFFANPALLYLALVVGYGEYWGLLATLLGILFKDFWHRYLFVFISSIITILIHEANFIIFFPIQLLSLILITQHATRNTQHATRNTQHATREKLVALLILAVSLTLFFFFVGFNTATPENALNLYKHIEFDLGIPVGKQNVLFLSDSLGGSFENMLSLVNKNPQLIAVFFFSIVLFSPTIFVALKECYFSIELLNKRSAVCISERLLKILTLLAPFSSLLLIFVAWDFIRWITLVVVCSFVLCLIYMDALNIKGLDYIQGQSTKLSLSVNSVILIFYLWLIPPIMGTNKSFSSFPFFNHMQSVKYLSENWNDVQYNFQFIK